MSFDTTLIYISPYLPTLAQVELIFGYLNKKFAAQNKQDKVNLNSKEADMMLINVLKLIDIKLVKRNFGTLCSELKINLNS